MMFCSRMLAKDTLELPAYIGLDRAGGYALDDQLIGFLSFGSFYRVRDESGGFKDGYSPMEDERANSFELPAGFTPGGMQNLDDAADHPDTNLIVEHVYSSFYDYVGSASAETPLNGETVPVQKADDIGYDGARYSFIKAPRYGRVPCEVGPLARLLNAREKLVIDTMRRLSASSYPPASVYTRILARMQETLLLSRLLRSWIGDLEIGRKYCVPLSLRQNEAGSGLIEAPRGALGHWLGVDGEGRISNYQVVAPTTWNASPRCTEQKNGPIELALLGGQTTPSGYLPGSEANPVGLYHVIRSFDPCVACAVHYIGR
jgi:hydrogenase large subunit